MSSTAVELSVTVFVSGFAIVSVIFLHDTFRRSGPWLIVMKWGSPALFAFCSEERRGEGPPAARAPLAARRRAARFMAGPSG